MTRLWDCVVVLIYKLLLPSEWAEFQARGQFDGSPFDRQSGFIHLSSRAQVAATALRVFPAEPELVIVAVDAELFGETLRWEPAPNGGLFPHLYGTMPLNSVAAIHHVPGAGSVDEALPPH